MATSDIHVDGDGWTVIFTDRYGGVSAAPYDEKNLALQVGDEPADVLENRRTALSMIGCEEPEQLTCGQQTHGCRIQVVGPEDIGRGALTYEDGFPETDGLMTALAGVPLAVFTADCLPLALYHPRAVAVVHCGWRGALAGIAGDAVRKMGAEYGSDAAEIEAFMGPHICVKCYEVGEDVAAKSAERGFACVRDIGGKPHVSLSDAVRRDLEEADVPAGRISDTPCCTAGTMPGCNGRVPRPCPHLAAKGPRPVSCWECHPPGSFFSYRREGLTGRQALIAVRL